MKKILGLLILGALIAFGCNKEKEYEPAQPESGAQYFFPVGTPLLYTIAESTTGFDFTIKRIVKDAAASVTIAVTDTSKTVYSAGFADILLNFAAGENEATITLPVDPTKYELGDKIGLDIEITEETTVYAPSALHVEFELPEPWVTLGKDASFSDSYWGDETAVEVQQNNVKPDQFRIVNPFDAMAKNAGVTIPEAVHADFLNFKILHAGDQVGDITVSEAGEGLIVFEEVCTGAFNSSYGAYVYFTHPWEFQSTSAEASWSHNKVLSWQDEEHTLPAQVQFAPWYYMYGVGGWNYSQYDGVSILTFPGVVIADYSTEVEYTGLFNKKDGSIDAIANVTLGEDVDYVKVALVPGDADDSYDSALDDALELILSEEESESVVVLKMSETKPVEGVDEDDEPITLHVGEVRIPMPEEIAEFYSFVVVPFNAEDEPSNLDISYDVFQFKDFGISLTLAEPETDDEGNGHITATLEFGEDTEAAFAVVAPGKDQAALYAALNLILSGDDSVKLVEEPGDVTFDLESEGDFIVMAASYAEGDLWNLDYKFFEYHAINPWISLGNALYRDGFVYGWYNIQCLEYEVEIQESRSTPGYYRLVNPYGEAFLYNDEGDYDTDKNYYLEIHAEDPEGVWIPVARSNMHWSDGYFTMGSLAGYYIEYGGSTLEEQKAAGNTGTLVDGVITFPVEKLLIAEQNYNNNTLYLANSAGSFRVILPEANAGTTSVKSSVKKPRNLSRKPNTPADNNFSKKPAFSKTLKVAAVSVKHGKASSRGFNAKPVYATKR